MLLHHILDKIFPLPLTSKEKIEMVIEETHHKKGHILMKADKVENHLYLIQKGMVRAFSNQDGRDVTFWFGKEGDPVVSMRSYVARRKSYEEIELLEDCVFYKLSVDQLQKLYSEDIHLANWGRKFAESELIKTEEYLISRQFRTATERYQDLMTNEPQLLQRVPLGFIASYLGISQVSLSRIRSGMK